MQIKNGLTTANINSLSSSIVPTIKFPLERLNDDNYFTIIKKQNPGVLSNSLIVPKKLHTIKDQISSVDFGNMRSYQPEAQISKKTYFLDLLISKDKKIYEIFSNVQSNKA